MVDSRVIAGGQINDEEILLLEFLIKVIDFVLTLLMIRVNLLGSFPWLLSLMWLSFYMNLFLLLKIYCLCGWKYFVLMEEWFLQLLCHQILHYKKIFCIKNHFHVLRRKMVLLSINTNILFKLLYLCFFTHLLL